MNRIKTKKLTLSTETLRMLEQEQLSRVAGGYVPSLRCSYYCTMNCSEGCPPPPSPIPGPYPL